MIYFIFCVSLASFIYTWLIYPVLLAVARYFLAVTIRREQVRPTVSIVLSCLNEEKQLADRIENLLSLNYPRERMEVVVASDGSTDATYRIAHSYTSRGVTAVNFLAKRGKASVHNDLIDRLKGEVVVFTDADPRFEPDLLDHLLSPFADAKVGCVLAEIDFVNQHDSPLTRHRGLYWRFEMLLRRFESDLGILSIGSGPCMAVKRCLLRRLDKPSYDVDFITSLDVIEQGYLVVQEPRAVITDYVLATAKGEFRADVRMVAKNMLGTLERWLQLSPFRYPGVSLSLISHKFLRWLTPFFMLSLFITNVFLIDRRFFTTILMLQLFFYSAAVLGALYQGRPPRFWGLSLIISTPYSFCLANTAFFWGILRSVFGKPIASYQNLK